MKISELEAELARLRERHGDFDCVKLNEETGRYEKIYPHAVIDYRCNPKFLFVL
jgi:hypothetical protein